MFEKRNFMKTKPNLSKIHDVLFFKCPTQTPLKGGRHRLAPQLILFFTENCLMLHRTHSSIAYSTAAF